MSDVLELFGQPSSADSNWESIVVSQACPFLGRRCVKVRKSEPEVSIGTCSVTHGRDKRPMIICPFRLLERRQIFLDCIHLLLSHEPGNQLHIVPEVTVPGGSVDYFLASATNGKVRDFVGIEIQALDTTGTVWPARQRFLEQVWDAGVRDSSQPYRTYGMNWKMTAKTTLIQMHHKIQTFEAINRRLVLVMQDRLLQYLKDAFDFGHVGVANVGDAMHFHSYRFGECDGHFNIDLVSRLSTGAEGVGVCLGLKADPKVEFTSIALEVERKLSRETVFRI